jgi:hypothetical protein
MKSLFFTQHAQDAIDEPDPRRPGVERRFRAIPEYGNRVLRVACYETVVEIRILTVFFDRDARRP